MKWVEIKIHTPHVRSLAGGELLGGKGDTSRLAKGTESGQMVPYNPSIKVHKALSEMRQDVKIK